MRPRAQVESLASDKSWDSSSLCHEGRQSVCA